MNYNRDLAMVHRLLSVMLRLILVVRCFLEVAGAVNRESRGFLLLGWLWHGNIWVYLTFDLLIRSLFRGKSSASIMEIKQSKNLWKTILAQTRFSRLSNTGCFILRLILRVMGLREEIGWKVPELWKLFNWRLRCFQDLLEHVPGWNCYLLSWNF